jgi:hypothetical protein
MLRPKYTNRLERNSPSPKKLLPVFVILVIGGAEFFFEFPPGFYLRFAV